MLIQYDLREKVSKLISVGSTFSRNKRVDNDYICDGSTANSLIILSYFYNRLDLLPKY